MVFLLLGAVVNVAVAAGIAQFSYPSSSLAYAQVLAVLRGRVNPGSSGSGIVYESFLEEGIGVTHQGTVLDNGSTLIAGDESIDLQISVGWPFRFLRAQSHFRNGQWISDRWLFPLVPRTDVLGYEWGPELPLRPLWPGFLANTTFYAATWFVLLTGPGILRRYVRRRRGRCLTCGYDLSHADHEACPECGVAGGAMNTPIDQGR